MSKSRGAAPTRGLRAPTLTPKRPALDPLRVAAEIVAALADAVVVTSLDRKVLTANRSAAELFGRRLADLPGTPIDDLVAAAERQHVAEREQRAVAGAPQRYETTVVRADGEERNVAVSTTPLVLDGDLVGTVATLRDITEEKGAQDALARSEARYRNLFESASDAIVTLDANGRFTTFNHAAENISGYPRQELVGQWFAPLLPDDELPKALMHFQKAFAQLLLTEKRFPPDQRTAAEMIYAEARRASRIVQNLLTFARQHKPERTPTGVNQVLDDTLELRGYELRVRGIEVTRDYDEQIPETMADAHQLQQVFLNLVTNAEQAMEKSPRESQRLIVRTRRTGAVIRIEVEDTGPGIPPNLLERIFNPFFTTKPTGSGTGLGLSISLGIVREHEGRIWAENAPQGGARFIVEVPIVTHRASSEAQAIPLVPLQGDRLQILVVDDEASVRVSLQRYLAGRGHEVETTSSGREALGRLREGKFDAVIVDMRMPDISGEELYRDLRTTDPDQADRIIFTTGQLVDDEVRTFLASTGRPCVPKPFEFAAFDQALPAARRG